MSSDNDTSDGGEVDAVDAAVLVKGGCEAGNDMPAKFMLTKFFHESCKA